MGQVLFSMNVNCHSLLQHMSGIYTSACRVLDQVKWVHRPVELFHPLDIVRPPPATPVSYPPIIMFCYLACLGGRHCEKSRLSQGGA